MVKAEFATEEDSTVPWSTANQDSTPIRVINGSVGHLAFAEVLASGVPVKALLDTGRTFCQS